MVVPTLAKDLTTTNRYHKHEDTDSEAPQSHHRRGGACRRKLVAAPTVLPRRCEAPVHIGLVARAACLDAVPWRRGRDPYLIVITDTHPATVPQVTLTHGSRQVVFQGMQHIGSEHFYKAVIYDVE